MVRLVDWAQALRSRVGSTRAHPVLWLFTDEVRVPDVCAAVAALSRGLPRGLTGVVFRHDNAPGRAALARTVAKLCRRLGHRLVVAGDARLAASVGAGLHLRGGRWPAGRRAWLRHRALVTSSAHGPAELRRARLGGADLAFLSPVWATASHPGARPLGVVRSAALANAGQRRGLPVLALGGVGPRSVGGLPPSCHGAGAIAGLASTYAPCGPSATVFRNCHKVPTQPVAPGRTARQ